MSTQEDAPAATFGQSLLVGATGMLTRAAHWVVARSVRSVVVSRRASTAGGFRFPERVVARDLGYREPDAFMDALGKAGALDGTDLAVLWIHDIGAAARHRLIGHLFHSPCLIVDVRGSRDLTELSSGAPRGDGNRAGRSARIVTVTLGHIVENRRRRWLTWDEISDGVVAAISARQDRLVGSPENPGAAPF